MPAHSADESVSSIAAAIGEPARARMLYCLLDGRARTSTELAIVAGVSPPTATVHLQRLKSEGLVVVSAQGKHRYYSLADVTVARALEALSVLAGGSRAAFTPTTPVRLRLARKCYDHLAGAVGVALHDSLITRRWLSIAAHGENAYDVTAAGAKSLDALGVDVDALRRLRRRFACACLDWSERRPHLGGALGAALLALALEKKWIAPDLDSRALTITRLGRRELHARFDLDLVAH